jgi:hypothetical protein
MLAFSASMMLMTGALGLPSGSIETSGARFSTLALTSSWTARAYSSGIFSGSKRPLIRLINSAASATASRFGSAVRNLLGIDQNVMSLGVLVAFDDLLLRHLSKSITVAAGKGAIAITEWNEDFSVEAFRKLDEIKPLDPGLSGRVTLSYTQLSLIIDRMGREPTDVVAFWKLARKAGAVADD